MPNTAELFENAKKTIWKAYSGDASKMLLHLGTLGWILSAIAQVGAIVKNDKVPAEQKKFLIPQEIADAALNITSFYLVTRGLQNGLRKLVGSGFITTKPIREFCESHNIKMKKNSTDISKVIKNTIEENTKTIEIGGKNLSEEGQKLCKETISQFDEFNENHYEKFEGGIKMIGNLVGAILASNIITPMFRNPIAAMRQKTAIAASLHATNPLVKPVMDLNIQQNKENKPQLSNSQNLLNVYKPSNLKV